MLTPGLALVPVSCTPAIVLDLDTGDNSSARAEQIEQQIGGGVCPTAGVRVTLHTLSLGHCAATVLGWSAIMTRGRQNICTARLCRFR